MNEGGRERKRAEYSLRDTNRKWWIMEILHSSCSDKFSKRESNIDGESVRKWKKPVGRKKKRKQEQLGFKVQIRVDKYQLDTNRTKEWERPAGEELRRTSLEVEVAASPSAHVLPPLPLKVRPLGVRMRSQPSWSCWWKHENRRNALVCV